MNLLTIVSSKFLFSSRTILCRQAVTAAAAVRVRFAPSPTGQLHLGGLRTALYNYLFARCQNGSFILRIEDTDQTRLVPGAVESLIQMLQWTGIDIDEGPTKSGNHGPYIQSERLDIYSQQIQALLANGSAYHCFCTPKRLDLLRKEAVSRGEIPKYDNRCRNLATADVHARLGHGEKYVIRFKLQHYAKPWHDLVYGPIVYDVASIEGDPILMKSDGYPTYHFANVVDDHLMGITHVLRGVEWQVSTTKHLLLYNAFGWTSPMFAHLPLLMNKDGKKLSKRQNDVHVEHYQNLGYFPEAVLNLLTNMGSGFKVRETAGLNLQELIGQFDLMKLNTNCTRIDFDRLLDFNRLHLQRRLNDSHTRSCLIEEIQHLVNRHAAEHNLKVDLFSSDRISRMLDISKDRLCLLTDVLKSDHQYAWLAADDTSVNQLCEDSDIAIDVITRTIDSLLSLDAEHYDQKHLLSVLQSVIETSQWTNAQYMKLMRRALCLPSAGPPIIDIITVLGKEATLIRLHRVRTNCSRTKSATTH